MKKNGLNTNKEKKMDKLIGKIQKTDRKQIQIKFNTFKGNTHLDIRTTFKINNDWVPTKKGVTVNPKDIGQVISLLEKAEDEWSKTG
jgi:hypothetical protein